MADCNACKEARRKTEPVPYIVHETALARMERHARRIWIALIIAICMVFASNAIWLYAWTQYDYTGQQVEYIQDGRGINIIGNENGVDLNGTEDYSSQKGSH